MKISITLPSIHKEACWRTLENLRTASVGEVEVVVCSPFQVTGSAGRLTVVWIEDDERAGPNAGHRRAFGLTTGDYVLSFVDDHTLVPRWDEEALRDFDQREHASPQRPFVLGLRQLCAEPRIGTVFGRYYPYFPFMRRTDAQHLGWFDGAFRKGFADVDLAFRAYALGGRCEWSEGLLVVPEPDDNRHKDDEFGSTDADRALFLARWADRYGAAWDTSHHRGFNRDVPAPAGVRTLP